MGRPRRGQGDWTPYALQRAVKTCTLSTVGLSKPPESGDAWDVSVVMSALLPFKAALYYYPRKRVITTGHLLDSAQSRFTARGESHAAESRAGDSLA